MSRSNAGRIGVWGASGSGKSSYVKRRIRGEKRLVVFDPLAEYGPLCKVSVTSVDQVRQAMRADWKGFQIAYKPTPGQETRCLSALCRLLMAAQRPYQEAGMGSGLTLVVEEMNLSFPVAGGDQKCRGFAEICSRGRHFGIEVFGLSQRIAEVATRFRGNCTETVVLRQKGPRDLKAAAEELGIAVSEVSKLENLQYLHEQNGKISPGKISFK